MDSWLRNPAAIRQALREAARTFVSYAAALYVSIELRRRFGNVHVMPKDCHGKTAAELRALFPTAIKAEHDRLGDVLSIGDTDALIDEKYSLLQGSIDSDTDDWKKLIPGKPILAMFSSKAQLTPSRLKTLFVTAASATGSSPFGDIVAIFSDFATAT